jgi:hypothetical protein
MEGRNTPNNVFSFDYDTYSVYRLKQSAATLNIQNYSFGSVRFDFGTRDQDTESIFQ